MKYILSVLFLFIFLSAQAQRTIDLRSNAQKTAFGELEVESKRPYIQAIPVYGLIPANFREYTNASGTTGVTDDNLFEVTTGTTIGGYGSIQSFRPLNYKAGEGGVAMFTALFDTSAINSVQGVGLGNIGDELSFGYSDTTFGVWHKRDGRPEVRTIKITASAGGAETLTLTLDSTDYSIPLTSGTPQHNAHEIEQWLNNNQSVWVADQLDSTVIVSAQDASSRSRTYTYSSSGASTGIVTQNRAGKAKTEAHVAWYDWNGEGAFNGFDPSLGNVYKISYQYLGFGAIKFYIENPEDGEFDLVHTIKYPNTDTVPSLGQPSLRALIYSASLGSTTDLSVKCASYGAFIQGLAPRGTRNPRGYQSTQSVSTSFTNVITFRNRRTYNSRYNQIEILPKILTVSNESTKNVVVQILASTGDPFAGDTNFQEVGSDLITDVDITANTLNASGYRVLQSYTVSGGGSLNVDLDNSDIVVPPSLKFIVVARVTSGTSANVTASFSWIEDL